MEQNDLLLVFHKVINSDYLNGHGSLNYFWIPTIFGVIPQGCLKQHTFVNFFPAVLAFRMVKAIIKSFLF